MNGGLIKYSPIYSDCEIRIVIKATALCTHCFIAMEITEM